MTLDLSFPDFLNFFLKSFRFLVRVSYLEIYNENVKDLLGRDQQAKLEVSVNNISDF